MTIQKSKAGNIYLTLVSGTEKMWAKETTGITVGENGKFAYIQPEKIETIDDAASIFRMMNMVARDGQSAYEISKEVVNLVNARALELKNA